MQACSLNEIPMSIDIYDSDSEADPEDSEENEESKQLRNAKTLRLDDFADPRSEAASVATERQDGKAGNNVEGRDGKADTEADMWKKKCEEMAAMIAQLQKQQQQPSSPSLGTPTPTKLLFSPVPPSENGGALPAKPSPPALTLPPQVPKPETSKAAALPALPPVPKKPEVPAPDSAKSGLEVANPSKAAPAKACPAKAAASNGSVPPEDETTLRVGEEELAEQLDLSHEEGS